MGKGRKRLHGRRPPRRPPLRNKSPLKTSSDQPPKKILLDPNRHASLAERFLELCRTEYFGQKRLVDYAATALDRMEAFMKTGTRPNMEGVIGSILIPGPSGVGKTLLAELIAEVLTGSRKGLFLISGQLYQERHSVENLLGSPAGYVRSDEEPLLTQERLDAPAFDAFHNEALESLSSPQQKSLATLDEEYKKKSQEVEKLRGVWDKTKDESKRQEIGSKIGVLVARLREISAVVFEEISSHIVYNPGEIIYPSVVLADEFEKTHETLQRFFLDVLSRGEAQNRRHEEISFRASIILFTSNLCKDEIARFVAEQSGEARPWGFHSTPDIRVQADPVDDTELYQHVRVQAKKEFGPEFMGRLDQVILARILSPEQIKEILDAKIEKYLLYLINVFPIKFKITEEALDFVLMRATRRRSEGARLLDKTFERYVYGPIDVLRITEQIKEGDHVVIELSRGEKRPRLLYHKIEHPNRNKLLPVYTRNPKFPPA